MSEIDYKFENLHLKNAQEVSDYAANVISNTEHLIRNVVPDKILFLEKIAKEEILPFHDISSITKDLVFLSEDSKAYLPRKIGDNGGYVNDNEGTSNVKEGNDAVPPPIPCNEKLTRLIDILKPEMRDMVDTCEAVSLWITLLIPKIEDGNNFGVSIQEEVFSEIQRIQDETIDVLSDIPSYFMSRARMASKITKYPFVADYRRAMKEVDDEEYLKISNSMNKLRSNYVVILDTVSKNYEKIKTPRSKGNVDSMY